MSELGAILRAAAADVDELEQTLAQRDATIADLRAQLVPTPVPTPTGPKLGVSFGGYQVPNVVGKTSTADRVANFEKYLGRPVGVVMCFLEEFDLPKARVGEHQMMWSPKWRLRPTRTPDSAILTFCQRLISLGQPDAIIRFWWEPNGQWMDGWNALVDKALWVVQYRRTVQLIRTIPGQRFRFEWNINITTNLPAEAESFYPGDDVVDIVGMDVYGNYPVGKWTTAATGLGWLASFAARHGKPFGFSEWGVSDIDDSSYLAAMRAAIENPRCAYAIYNEYDAGDGSHAVSTGKYPKTTALLKTLP